MHDPHRPAVVRAYAQLVSGQGDVLRFTAVVTADDGLYVARCLDVEVTSQGNTIESALDNLREALELYFEDQPVPRPLQPIVAPVEVRIPA